MSNHMYDVQSMSSDEEFMATQEFMASVGDHIYDAQSMSSGEQSILTQEFMASLENGFHSLLSAAMGNINRSAAQAQEVQAEEVQAEEVQAEVHDNQYLSDPTYTDASDGTYNGTFSDDTSEDVLPLRIRNPRLVRQAAAQVPPPTPEEIEENEDNEDNEDMIVNDDHIKEIDTFLMKSFDRPLPEQCGVCYEATPELGNKFIPCNTCENWLCTTCHTRTEKCPFCRSEYVFHYTMPLERAVLEGDLDSVRSIAKFNLSVPSPYTFDMAAVAGNLQIMQWLHFHYPDIRCERGLEFALNSGNRELVEFIITREIGKCDDSTFALATFIRCDAFFRTFLEYVRGMITHTTIVAVIDHGSHIRFDEIWNMFEYTRLTSKQANYILSFALSRGFAQSRKLLYDLRALTTGQDLGTYLDDTFDTSMFELLWDLFGVNAFTSRTWLISDMCGREKCIAFMRTKPELSGVCSRGRTWSDMDACATT